MTDQKDGVKNAEPKQVPPTKTEINLAWLRDREQDLAYLVGEQVFQLSTKTRQARELQSNIDRQTKELESLLADIARREGVVEKNQTALDFVQVSIQTLEGKAKNGAA